MGVDTYKFYFDHKNYFIRFTSHHDGNTSVDDEDEGIGPKGSSIGRSIRHALEYFVCDLRHDRNKTIERFLKEKSVDGIFRSLAQLLLSNDDRVCGNSAYILGSTVELEAGLNQFIATFSNTSTTNNVDVILTLCRLLTHPDLECVLNAAGTLGTICSSKDGRNLLLNHSCISQLIINTSSLLASNNSWIASNVALVLARLTVEEVGCQTILAHSNHRDILNKLVLALDVAEPNRSTNAAFAIGRLIEKDEGKRKLISTCGQRRVFDALLQMFEVHEEKGVNKNACYALSCMCTTVYGFQLCQEDLSVFHRILAAIEAILLSVEHENVWFALMSLRTIAQYDGANEHLSHSETLLKTLKKIREKWRKHKDVQDEAKSLWYTMHRNRKPDPPNIDECRSDSADISWILSADSWDDDDLEYQIILDDTPIAETKQKTYCLKDLKPNKTYSVQIQYKTPYGYSVPSTPTTFHTDETLPPPVSNLQVARRTMIAARISWDAPDLTGFSSFKGYQVYLDDVEYECTSECGITIGSLLPSKAYEVAVCVLNGKGKGPCESINFTTASPGDIYPAPPVFSVVGRREIHIKWQPPEVISGRFTRYELYCHKKCIYSGVEQEFHATMLKPDTEYAMEVVVITHDGRFRSRQAKVRTLKDEFCNTNRHSLYEPLSSHPAKLKRNETFDSLPNYSTNNVNTSKTSAKSEKSLPREIAVSTRNIQITTVQPLKTKTQGSSINRSLPLLLKNSQSRPVATAPKVRQSHRSHVNPSSSNQRPPKARPKAPMIIQTLEMESDCKNSWATPVVHRATQATSYRYSLTSKPPVAKVDSKKADRSAFASLPDVPIDITRSKSLVPS